MIQVDAIGCRRHDTPARQTMAGTPPHDCCKDCPALKTPDTDGPWYHLCYTNPISHEREALLTADECGKFKGKGVDPCQRCGLSVFPSEADCRDFYRMMAPAVASKWKFVAVAELKPEHGWVKPSIGKHPNHHTWWPATEVTERCSLFRVLPGELS